MNKCQFESIRILREDKIPVLAKAIGISESGLRKKINNLNEFKPSEIRKISERWGLTKDEVYSIFID